MYYVIQAYMFDAFFSATEVVGENQQERPDLTDYSSLLKECYKKGVYQIVISGNNVEYLTGLIDSIKFLENEMFGENKIQYQIMQMTEVIPV